MLSVIIGTVVCFIRGSKAFDVNGRIGCEVSVMDIQLFKMVLTRQLLPGLLYSSQNLSGNCYLKSFLMPVNTRMSRVMQYERIGLHSMEIGFSIS